MDLHIVSVFCAIILLVAHFGWQVGRQTYHGAQVNRAVLRRSSAAKRNKMGLTRWLHPALIPAYHAAKTVLLLGAAVYIYWMFLDMGYGFDWQLALSWERPLGAAVALLAFTAWIAAGYRADLHQHGWPVVVATVLGIILYYPLLAVPCLVAVGLAICVRYMPQRMRRRSRLRLVVSGNTRRVG